MAQISLDIAIPAVRVGFFSGWPIHQDLVPAEQKKESRSIRLEEVYRRKSSYDQRLFQGCCQKPREWSTWRPLVIGNAAPGAEEPNLKRTATGIRGLLITAQSRICIRATTGASDTHNNGNSDVEDKQTAPGLWPRKQNGSCCIPGDLHLI